MRSQPGHSSKVSRRYTIHHRTKHVHVYYRYLPQNLLLCGLTPGPKELTGEELQYFMKAFVDDLLMLYDHGVLVQTLSHPAGRRVCLTLIAVCCDHPALCRMCGFADHSTSGYFCPRCMIRQEDLRTPNGVKIDGMHILFCPVLIVC